MREYLIKRVLLIVPTLFLVSLLVFLLMHMRSGDVVIQMLEGYAYADTVEALRRELGLDKPLHEQYLAWMGGVLQGDLGRSLWTKEPILVEFASDSRTDVADDHHLGRLRRRVGDTVGRPPGDLDRLSRESRGHPGAGHAVFLAGHTGSGAPRHLLALDAAVDLCAAEHRCHG